MERITLEQAYQLSAVNFLNDLAFLKDKRKHDEMERKRLRQKLNLK